MTPAVGRLVGSKSDMPVLKKRTARLEELGIEYEIEVCSAHRNPESVSEHAGTARERSLKMTLSAPDPAEKLEEGKT